MIKSGFRTQGPCVERQNPLTTIPLYNHYCEVTICMYSLFYKYTQYQLYKMYLQYVVKYQLHVHGVFLFTFLNQN